MFEINPNLINKEPEKLLWNIYEALKDIAERLPPPKKEAPAHDEKPAVRSKRAAKK